MSDEPNFPHPGRIAPLAWTEGPGDDHWAAHREFWGSALVGEKRRYLVKGARMRSMPRLRLVEWWLKQRGWRVVKWTLSDIQKQVNLHVNEHLRHIS